VNSFKTPLLKVTGLLALALLLVFGCAETPEDPDTNRVPNTFISSYSINTGPDSSTYYGVTVYWRGSDMDGEPVAYRYWVDSGDPTETLETQATVALSFPDNSTTYTFYVQAKDNMNEWDPTAASVVIDMNDVRDVTDPTFMPNTLPVSVPPNGASTSRGVPFAIAGTDVDGVVLNFQYAVDDPGTWTTVPPDILDVISSAAEIVLRPSDLTLGAHTIYFRSVDNMGNVDPSPVVVSIICEAGYAPELALSVADGQIFVVPYTNPTITDFTVTVTATVDFYYGKIDSFVVSTSEGGSFTTTDPDIVLGDLIPGAYWVDVTAWDAAGASTATGQVNFTVSELGPDNGVLCVNGIDWPTYPGDAENLWESGAPWGYRTHFKTWDLFDTSPIYSGTDFGDSLLGLGGGVPAWMLDTDFFEAISWIGNAYSGDIDFWADLGDEIMAYLEAGGNILLPVRYGSDWFGEEDGIPALATYCGIVDGSWVTPGGDDLTAKVGTLTDITQAITQSLWEIPMTNNPDNVWIYEAAAVAPGMHAGFITLPNGEGGGGAFCYIAGRSYRWDNAELKANVDVILNTYFGVQ
jgi:hypothetical protein